MQSMAIVLPHYTSDGCAMRGISTLLDTPENPQVQECWKMKFGFTLHTTEV